MWLSSSSQTQIPWSFIWKIDWGGVATDERRSACGVASVDAEGRLLGVVSVEEVYLAMRIPDAISVVLIEDLMRSDVSPLQLSDSMDRAMELFVENDLLELPVVDDSEQNRVVGTVSRAEISGTYLRHVQGAVGKAKRNGVNRRL